jgi:two-component system response regulator
LSIKTPLKEAAALRQGFTFAMQDGMNTTLRHAATPLHPKRVLVAEDTDDIRDMMGFVLRSENMVMLEARNGQEAIEVCQAEAPDLILMDISMPIMDGFTAIERLKSSEATRDIPIVALSIYCDEHESHARALGNGCLKCLRKPFDFKQIKEVLSAI